MLQGDDQQRLAEIERHLHDTDPAFADRFRRWPPRRRTLSPTAALLLGLALLVVGAATGWWAISLLGTSMVAVTIVALRRARRR
ncbi:DUF3040 domain-containing protein [Dactylosporangium cerinum]|uniref:DUF3040 domain-containing protein n=1 Tax=Dactylosporangium cerinum TaxID=1434730 RepID=A0ABV9WFA1_9ACTN